MTLLEKFLQKIQVIKALKPVYRQPGDGSDGTCDCIGLVIGAFRRAGIKWSGIHGTNWFARKEVTSLKKLESQSELKLGDVVFKVYEPGQSGYALPARYKKGGKYYNGDLRDYMHIGVITSVDPFNITHMGTVGLKVDKSIGKYWKFKAWLTKLGDEPTPELPPQTPTAQSQARVTAPSGKYVKMRKEPSTKCRLYEEVPIGAILTIEEPGDEWAKVSYGKYKNYYMMAKFLEIV